MGRKKARHNTELIAALIQRQDAMSRRTAVRINAILETHVTVAEARRYSREIAEAACAKFIPMIGQIGPALLREAEARGMVGVEKLLTEEIRRRLTELAETGSTHASPPPARVRVKTSKNLAAARSQNARLAAELMDLRARIVRLDDPGVRASIFGVAS